MVLHVTGVPSNYCTEYNMVNFRTKHTLDLALFFAATTERLVCEKVKLVTHSLLPITAQLIENN